MQTLILEAKEAVTKGIDEQEISKLIKPILVHKDKIADFFEKNNKKEKLEKLEHIYKETEQPK